MLSFKQYLSESFSPRNDRREEHPDLISKPERMWQYADYRHEKRDADGKPVYSLSTYIQPVTGRHDKYNGWTEVEFSVNGAYEKESLAPEKRVPLQHILGGATRVFSHVNHYHSQAGLGKGILFATKNRKKHDLYMRMADRFGVPAVNVHETQMKDK